MSPLPNLVIAGRGLMSEDLKSQSPAESELTEPVLDPPATLPEPVLEPESIVARKNTAELSRLYAGLSALYVAGARLCAMLEWDPLIQELLHVATELVHADGVSLMLMDEHHGDLRVAGTTHLGEKIIADTIQAIGDGVAGWVAQHREAVLLVGQVEPGRFPNFSARPDVVGSAICVPLIPPPTQSHPTAVLGVLNVIRRVDTPPLTQDDLELVTALSTQAGTALQNARLYKQLERRNAQLENLIEISGNLAVSLGIDHVLRSTVERAVEFIHCEAGSLLLVDDATNELLFKIALGPAGAKLINTRLPPGAGIAGTVVHTGEPLIVNDAKSDPRHYPNVDASTALTTRSLLCVPLIGKDRVIGALEVMNKVGGLPFEKEDQDSLAAFAIQSTIALENARLYSELRGTFRDTVRVIANAVEARDPYTAGHSERVTQVALETARELGWEPEKIDLLEIGALLHDIGKIGVSDAILRKPGPLTSAEYQEMKEHPVLGVKMLESVSVLRPILPYILYHQEHYDGNGYPFGLAGKEIPIEGRLLAVADTLDAMISDRPYRSAMSMEQAIAEIVRNRGTQFDPEIVDALLRVAANGKFDLLPIPAHHSSTSV